MAADSELPQIRLHAQTFALCPEPSAWTEDGHRARLMAVRSGGYRAVLSGIGGDEFTGGVPDPRAHLADLIVQFKFVSLPTTHGLELGQTAAWVQLLWQSAIDILPPL